MSDFMYYKPRLAIKRRPQKISSTRIHSLNAKCGHHLFSEIEIRLFLLLYQSDVVDLCEQFPLGPNVNNIKKK
jgi:hypothetical protein